MHILMTPYVAKAKVSFVWLKIFCSLNLPLLLHLFVYALLSLNFLSVLLAVCVYIRKNFHIPNEEYLSGLCVYEHVHCICELLIYIEVQTFHYHFLLQNSFISALHTVVCRFSFYTVYLIQTYLYTHLILKNDTIATLTVRALELVSQHICVCVCISFFLCPLCFCCCSKCVTTC